MPTWVQNWRCFLVREPHHSSKVDAWVRSMARSYAHKCVLHNLFRREARGHNLDRNILADFFDRLGDLLELEARNVIGMDAELIRKVTDTNPEFYMKGRRHPRVPVPLSRFVTVKDFAQYYASQLPIFLNGARPDEVMEAIEAGLVKVEDLHIPQFPSPRPWWVTPTEDAEGAHASKIRDMLGLAHYSKESFVEFQYPADAFPSDMAAPTVLDAGDHLLFRSVVPIMGRADDGWGRTLNLSTYSEGFREAVHAPLETFSLSFILSTTDYIEGRGSSPLWKSLYVQSETQLQQISRGQISRK